MNSSENSEQCSNDLEYAEHLKQSVNEIDSLIQDLSHEDSLQEHEKSEKIQNLKKSLLSILDKSPDSIRKSKAQIIIRAIIYTISGCGDYILKFDELDEFINEFILKKACDIIQSADYILMLKIEKVLYEFIITSWSKKCTFSALEFTSHLYTFICKIGPPEVGKELLQNFSTSSMPFHVKIYIQPCLLIASENITVNPGLNAQSLLNDFDLYIQLELKGEKFERSKIETIIKTFWTNFIKNWQNEFIDSQEENHYWEITTSFCVKTSFLIHKLEAQDIQIILQAINSKFFVIPKQAGVQNGVVILLSLLQLQDLTCASYWESIVELCRLIVGTSISLSREEANREGAYFGVKAVAFFLSSTGPPGEVIESFASILSNFRPPKSKMMSDGKDENKKELDDLKNVVSRLQKVKKFSQSEKSRITSLANNLLRL